MQANAQGPVRSYLPCGADRRKFLKALACTTAFTSGWCPEANAGDLGERSDPFRFRYMLASCLFGYQYLGEILPQVRACGATHLDLWPKVHGNQREQLTDLGVERFTEMLERHDVQLGCITQYKLGPFGLADELRLAGRLGCRTMVTGGAGPKGLSGAELKLAVREFVERLKPTLAIAEEEGVCVAIENHGNNLIESPDSLRWLAELRPSKHLGIALAPYHLTQEPKKLASLIRDLGPAIEMFYAWEHGNGCMKVMPTEEELLQLPVRGPLDFGPMVEALQAINYRGWTEIFMHPTPRGRPMLPMPAQVTDELNRSRAYLDSLIAKS
ncbi:MAG TPA: xylose isomerase [Planctomycetaceae bacterium]|nr:xylose isomerase [Planctomycetaceae bacterium]